VMELQVVVTSQCLTMMLNFLMFLTSIKAIFILLACVNNLQTALHGDVLLALVIITSVKKVQYTRRSLLKLKLLIKLISGRMRPHGYLLNLGMALIN